MSFVVYWCLISSYFLQDEETPTVDLETLEPHIIASYTIITVQAPDHSRYT